METQSRTVLVAAMLVTFVTGSIHAFSVFLIPLESLLQLPRAEISLFYSFALIFLTVSVLFGYRIYALVSPAIMIMIACTLTGVGLIVSAYGTTWWSIFFGYSVLFGTANGIGYGYVLQLVGRALPQSKGFAMAVVTAAYAVGSVVFSLVLAYFVENYSLTTAFLVLAGFIITGGFLSAALMKISNVRYTLSASTVQTGSEVSWSIVVLLWLAYGASVFAGLMAIGHAAGIVQNLGELYSVAIWGAVFIGIGSSLGGFIIGWVIRNENMNFYLTSLPIISALFLAILVFIDQPIMAIALLSVVGFAYGALIAVYPFAISVYFGDAQGPKVYGWVFTAWGFAGLAGPWSAGKIFNYFGQYDIALSVACSVAIFSSIIFLITAKRINAAP